jgi:hypothetical protein
MPSRTTTSAGYFIASLFSRTATPSARWQKPHKQRCDVHRRYAFLVKQKDQSGGPLVTTGSAGASIDAYGGAAAVQTVTGVAGEAVGPPVVPSWAGVDNHIYVVKVDDSILLESSTFNFRYEEVLGPSAIRLGVWGYAAPVIGRYPTSIAEINSGTTSPAPAEADVEVVEVETRSAKK